MLFKIVLNVAYQLILFYKQLDAEDDDDDDYDYNDEDFGEARFEEEGEASNYWQLKNYTFEAQKNVRNDDDEAGSANPWRKTGGLRLTRNEYHRFCDAQLECNVMNNIRIFFAVISFVIIVILHFFSINYLF